MKKCNKCKQEKDYEGFYRDKEAKDGYNTVCKQCRLEADRERRKKDPEWVKKRKLQNKEHHIKNRESIADRKKVWISTESGRRSHLASSQKFREKNPDKRYAHDAVYRAVVKGELVRPTRCQICDGKEKIEAHHASYDQGKRTSIIWVCKYCHAKIHIKEEI